MQETEIGYVKIKYNSDGKFAGVEYEIPNNVLNTIAEIFLSYLKYEEKKGRRKKWTK